MMPSKTLTHEYSIPNVKYDENGNPVEILKVKPIEPPKDNRKINFTRTRRHELSKQFKKIESTGIGKPASINLNVWMLTSKKKKKILFDSVNKDIYGWKTITKNRFKPNDFSVKFIDTYIY